MVIHANLEVLLQPSIQKVVKYYFLEVREKTGGPSAY